MATKECDLCGSKIGFLDQDLKFKDKQYICHKCIAKYKFSKKEGSDQASWDAIKWSTDHSLKEFKENYVDQGKTFKDALAEQQKVTTQKKEAKEKEIAPTNFKTLSKSPVVVKAAEKINELPIPQEIKKQLIDAQAFDFSFNKKELKALPEVLDYKNGEVIKYAASGTKVEQNETRTVLILCTNRRVLFLNKNMFFGGDSTDIPLNMINAVQLTNHLLLSDITIVNGANSTQLKQLAKESAAIMAKTIKKESYKYQHNLLHPENNMASSIDPADEIRKFKKLADDGIITQEEFEAKKKQLLGL